MAYRRDKARGISRSSDVPFPNSPGASAFAGIPGVQAGPPGWHRAPVGLVVRAESAAESRFLVPADECCGDQPEGCGVEQQTELAQEQRLADDDRQYRHIHGVADIAIQPADDQALRCGDRYRCPEAFHYETSPPSSRAIISFPRQSSARAGSAAIASYVRAWTNVLLP